MAADQEAITQNIVQAAVEAAKAAAQAMAVTTNEGNLGDRNKLVSMGAKLGKPTLKQDTFDKGATDKYTEFKPSV